MTFVGIVLGVLILIMLLTSLVTAISLYLRTKRYKWNSSKESREK